MVSPDNEGKPSRIQRMSEVLAQSQDAIADRIEQTFPNDDFWAQHHRNTAREIRGRSQEKKRLSQAYVFQEQVLFPAYREGREIGEQELVNLVAQYGTEQGVMIDPHALAVVNGVFLLIANDYPETFMQRHGQGSIANMQRLDNYFNKALNPQEATVGSGK